jgi:hypothetical protein
MGDGMRIAIYGLVLIVPLMHPSQVLAQLPMPLGAPASVTVLERSLEYRFQLDLAVDQSALNTFLPTGWVSQIATQGGGTGCNLRVIFIDRGQIEGADNKVLGKGHDVLAVLEAPVRPMVEAATRGGNKMIIGGISRDNAGGALLAAKRVTMTRTHEIKDESETVHEVWNLEATSGEHLFLDVTYRPAPANIFSYQSRFLDPSDPNQIKLVRIEEITDITRNVTLLPPDRVTSFSLKAGGGKFAPLFDGAVKVLSWDAQPVSIRTMVQQ